MEQLSVRVRGWLTNVKDSLWLLPTVAVLGAVALSWVLTKAEPLPDWADGFIGFGGSPETAQSLLGDLASATFTVTGVVFSLTVVALQMASAQFSPRLLRTFMTERTVQVSLAWMVGSGVYHVAVLRTVRSGETGDAFVPRLATSVALLGALGAAIILIVFLHHLTQRMRADVLMTAIREETLRQLRAIPTDRDELPDRRPPDPPGHASHLAARTAGYLQHADVAALTRLAIEHDLVVRLRPMLGEWVSSGTTLAWVWRLDGQDTAVGDELARAVHAAIHLGPDRSESQDIAFGLRELEDIAARALSTGDNDPTTAAQAVGQLAGILVHIAGHPLGVDLGRDDEGRIRAAVPRPTFAGHLELAVAQVRRYGASEVAVILAVLHLLTDVAERVADSAERRAAVEEQLERTLEVADIADGHERRRIEVAADAVRLTLDRGHRPAGEVEAR